MHRTQTSGLARRLNDLVNAVDLEEQHDGRPPGLGHRGEAIAGAMRPYGDRTLLGKGRELVEPRAAGCVSSDVENHGQPSASSHSSSRASMVSSLKRGVMSTPATLTASMNVSLGHGGSSAEPLTSGS